MSKQNDDQNIKVEIIEIKNSLKKRAVGIHNKETDIGFIPPELIAEADKEILKSCNSCKEVINSNLEGLTLAWSKMKAEIEPSIRKTLSQPVFLLAHEIKDIAAICGYDLIAYFSESLRDYVAKAELSEKAQVVIIQAHLDAIQIVHTNDIKKDGGEKAEELKTMVKRAIEKYS